MPAAPQLCSGLSLPGAALRHAGPLSSLPQLRKCFPCRHRDQVIVPVCCNAIRTAPAGIRPAAPQPAAAAWRGEHRSSTSCSASFGEATWDPTDAGSDDRRGAGGSSGPRGERTGSPPLLRHSLAFVHAHLRAILCIALAAYGMCVGAAKAGELHRRQATRGQAPQVAEVAETRGRSSAKERQAFSWQDTALLLDSRRVAHARPSNSPVRVSQGTVDMQQRQGGQPALLPRPAAQFASMSSPASWQRRWPIISSARNDLVTWSCHGHQH